MSEKKPPPSPLTLKFTVKKVREKKYFFVEEVEGITVFMTSVSPFAFEGYERTEPFRILRDTNKILEGHVSWVGGHSDHEIFVVDGNTVHELRADEWEEGDQLEVDTAKYTSPTDFATSVVKSKGIATSLKSAFAKHDGSLEKNEFIQAIATGHLRALEGVAEDKLFIL